MSAKEWTPEQRYAAALRIDKILDDNDIFVERVESRAYNPGILDLQCELTEIADLLSQSQLRGDFGARGFEWRSQLAAWEKRNQVPSKRPRAESTS